MRHTALVLQQGKQQLFKVIKNFARVFHSLNHMIQVVLTHKRTAGAALVGSAFLFSFPSFNNSAVSNHQTNQDEQIKAETASIEQATIQGETSIQAPNNNPEELNSSTVSGDSSHTSIRTTITSSTSINGRTESYSKTTTSSDGSSSSSVNISVNGDGESKVRIKGSSDSKLKFDYDDSSEVEID